MKQEPTPDYRDLRSRSTQRDTSVKCAAPPCAARVAYAGDFCADCRRVQSDMRARLRARRLR